MNNKELLLSAIGEMLSGNISEKIAVCENLAILTKSPSLSYAIVRKLSPSWGYFSGEIHYPVSGEPIWDVYCKHESFWKGEQRELRFSLLEHLKSELLKRTDEEVEELLG